MKFDDQKYIQHIDGITEQAINRAVPIYKQLLDTAEGIITRSESFDEAKRHIDQQLASPDFIKSLGEIIYNSTVRADAFGRSQIVEKDRYFSRKKGKVSAKYIIGKYCVSAVGMNWVAASDESVKVSFDLIPEDALKYLREKAFWISGISNQDVLNDIQRALESAIRDGKSYKEFAADMQQSIESFGYTGESPFRLETIFRTNIYSAYTIGQISQVDQVKDRFPKWRYVAIIDGRTRPLHRELNGKIFEYGKGPIPPIDYGCRCTPQFIHIYDVNTNSDVVSDAELDKLLQGTEVVRFDNQADFEKYRDQKAAAMDTRIKSQVLAHL